jgi:hypothetical protein
MHLRITLAHLAGRQLYVDADGRAPFLSVPTTNAVTVTWEKSVNRDLLVANPRELALEPLAELFARFGWERGTVDHIRLLQSELAEL